MKYDIPAALQVLTPGAEWVLRGEEYSGLEWMNGNGHDKPTEAALTAKIAELDGAEAMRLLRKERDKLDLQKTTGKLERQKSSDLTSFFCVVKLIVRH